MAATITSFSPASAAIGASVTITGTGFSDATTVKFNGAPAAFVINSSTQITATVPAMASSGKITVASSSASVSSATDFTLTATAPAATPGAWQTVFLEVPLNRKGWVDTGLTVGASERLRIRAFGQGMWRNENTPQDYAFPEGVYADSSNNDPNHEYNPASTLTSLYWNSSDMLVSNQGRVYGLAVEPMPGSDAPPLMSHAGALDRPNRDTRYPASSAIAGRKIWLIANDQPGSYTDNLGSFFVTVERLPATVPTISSLAPASGPIGTSVVITGTGFEFVSSVKFNGVAATAYTVNSSTQITATVPSGATTGTVSVTNDVGTGTSAGSFTVTPPAAPTGFAATGGDSQISLTWNSVSGATKYRLYRGTASGGPYSFVGERTTNSAVDTGLTNGTTYYYVVTVVKFGTESGNSNQASAAPIAPPPSLGEPPVPSVTLADLTASIKTPTPLSSSALSYNAQLSSNGGAYQTIAFGKLAGQTVNFAVQGATVYHVRWVAVNGATTRTGQAAEFVAACPPSIVGVPVKPAPPGRTIAGNPTRITVVPQAWVVDTFRPTTFMQIARNDAPDMVLATLTASGATWDDTNVQDFASYAYRVRVGNIGGVSDWSDYGPSIPVESQTCFLTIQSPPANDTLSGAVDVRVKVLDTQGETSNHVANVAGATLPPLLLRTGTTQSGTLATTWDTRDYASGLVELVARCIGSDGLPARYMANYTVENSLARLTRYKDEVYNVPPEAGQEYYRAYFGVRNGDLSTNPNRIALVQMAARTDATEGGPFDTIPTDPQAAAEAFLKHQLLIPSRGRNLSAQGRRRAHTDYRVLKELVAPGSTVAVRFKASPEISANFYQTGFDTLAQIEVVSDGVYRIFARDDDFDGAAILEFDGTKLSTKVDLTGYGARQVAQRGTYYYAVCQSGSDRYLMLFDTDPASDPRDAEVELVMRREPRKPGFVAAVGDNALIVCVDEALSSARTHCYQHSDKTGNPRFVWVLDAAVTGAWSRDGKLMLACGNALYSSDGGTAAPTLVHAFASPVISAGAMVNGQPAVGLQNGQLQRIKGNTWEVTTTLPGPVLATSAWAGGLDNTRLVAGGTGATVAQQATDALSWAGAFDVVPPAALAAPVTQIAALAQYTKQIKAASGSPTSPDYTPAVVREMLMVGTGSGAGAHKGLLATYERSAPIVGAFRSSQISRPKIRALSRKVSTQ